MKKEGGWYLGWSPRRTWTSKSQNGMVVTIPLFIVGFYLEYSFLSNPLHSSVIRHAGLISYTVEQWVIDPYANTTPNELKEVNCITIDCPTTLPFGNWASSTWRNFERTVKQGPLPSLNADQSIPLPGHSNWCRNGHWTKELWSLVEFSGDLYSC